MNEYTDFLENAMTEPGMEDVFLPYLKDILGEFRKLPERLDEFIRIHGYDDDMTDENEKADFLKKRFKSHHLPSQRDVDLWFTGKRFGRNAAFFICFAFDLTIEETDDFFKRVYQERSFDCRDKDEMVYFYCICNGYGYEKADGLIKQIEAIPDNGDSSYQVMYTAEIMRQVEDLDSDEDLLEFVRENRAQLDFHNYTAKENVRTLWNEIKDTAVKEDERFSELDDDDKERLSVQAKNGNKISIYDVFRFILGLTADEIKSTGSDRSIKPIIKALGPSVSDCFPEQQALGKILRDSDVKTETVRRMLILLAFYKSQAQSKLDGDIENAGDRCNAYINQTLSESGFDSMYPGNPYDWIFLYANAHYEGLEVFRDIMRELSWECDYKSKT